jgi:hypothetical protein
MQSPAQEQVVFVPDTPPKKPQFYLEVVVRSDDHKSSLYVHWSEDWHTVVQNMDASMREHHVSMTGDIYSTCNQVFFKFCGRSPSGRQFSVPIRGQIDWGSVCEELRFSRWGRNTTDDKVYIELTLKSMRVIPVPLVPLKSDRVRGSMVIVSTPSPKRVVLFISLFIYLFIYY